MESDFIGGDMEVIRCRDCKHFYRYSERWGVCEYTREHQEKALDISPDHFCGWAEKKEAKGENSEN